MKKENYLRDRLHNNYDFLRIFAATCIIFSHSFDLLNLRKDEPLIRLTHGKISFSFIGLSIFFGISGYLIAKSAIKSSTLKNFFWKRLLRIQPLLVITCIMTVLFLGPFFTGLSLKDYFLNTGTWSYFRNVLPMFGIQFTLPGVFTHLMEDSGVNGSLWTLIVEERLYLLMGLIFLFRKKYRIYFTALILLLNIMYLINRLAFNSSLIPHFNGSTFFYSIIFLNAAALSFIGINFSRHLWLYIVISTLCFLIALSFAPLEFIYFYAIPVLVNSVAQIKGVTNRAGKYGDFTYGIYVFSFPIQQVLIASAMVDQNPGTLFLYTLLIVIPMAVISWHFLEKRFLKLKNVVK